MTTYLGDKDATTIGIDSFSQSSNGVLQGTMGETDG